MAALLVLLLLLAVPPTAFTTTDVYYVTAHELSCPPHQICHNLSYYISQPDSYFTNDTTIIFLEGEHSFDREDLVHVSNVHNLTLKGQGQWPVAGAEETVMQSTVIINCTRGRGGFYFATSHNITVEGLTVVNCGSSGYQTGVFDFSTVQSLFFHKNSIQHMTGYGLLLFNCDNAIVTNCSYYHSALFGDSSFGGGGGVSIVYNTQYSNTGYTLELSHSNMTKCCNIYGSLYLRTSQEFGQAKVLFNHLKLTHNKAYFGGGISADLYGNGNVTLVISNCVLFNGSSADLGGGLSLFVSIQSAVIRIENTDFMDNYGQLANEISIYIDTGINSSPPDVTFIMINSTVQSEAYSADYGVFIGGCCANVMLTNTSMRFANIHSKGFVLTCTSSNINTRIQMDSCQFIGSSGVPSIIHLSQVQANITNCIFSNNTSDANGRSVIILQHTGYGDVIHSCKISDNDMTGITVILTSVKFSGHNVIQNNRNTEGAGITLLLPAYIGVNGELLLYHNTADNHGGAILVKQSRSPLSLYEGNIAMSNSCTLQLTGTIKLSGNRAGKGGSDMYGAILMDCNNNVDTYEPYYVPHVGLQNETSWYFDTPLMKQLHFSNTDRLSSMSSDPIMVCFCNTTSNLPDCSDRTNHIQTYPGLEINTSIATVGYYGGTSPGVVLVSAQHATLVRSYGQNETTNCFQLHVLLQDTSSTTALVDIRVDGGLQGLGVSIRVDILECPIGFTQISGQCHCEQLLDTSNVQCNLSATPFMFLRSGNSWFAYNNNTQCITGTTNCPFDYCNRSNVSFDIMAPDHQCVANRVGTLCGQCQSNLSIMLGSNRCGTCSNWYLFLLPVFALAGIMLLAVLMFLNLSVSVGTINGLLFYANMVKLNEAFFFPNGSVPVVSQFISWLNLDLGIEVCLFDGLDGYWNTWLQFVFPAYLLLLMGWYYCGLPLLCVALQAVWLSCCPSTSYTVSHVLH